MSQGEMNRNEEYRTKKKINFYIENSVIAANISRVEIPGAF